MLDLTELNSYISDLKRLQDSTRPAGLPSEVHYPAGEISIPAHISHWADVRGAETALVFDGREYTFAEVDDLHRRIAGWMSSTGVTKGDRVALHMGNCAEFYLCFLAVLRLGAVHVPVNPMFAQAELNHELSDAGPSLILCTSALKHLSENAGDARGDAVIAAVDEDWDRIIGAAPYRDDDGDLDSLAALNYTGGTTGLPKGCTHTQRDMLYTAASTATATELPRDGSFTSLCYLPVFWIAGEDLGLLLPIVLGGTSVLLARWNAAEVVDAIEKYGVSVMIGTVENYLEIMAMPDVADRDFSSMTDPQAVSFVRKMSPEVRHDWARSTNCTGVLREAAYGMTETHTLDAIPYGMAENDFDLNAEPVFCGLPVPGTDIAVVEFGTQQPVALDEVGEIIVRSPSVTSGYWRNEEATAAQIVDGWLHTGDTGRIDSDGYLHFLGRQKEMIKVNGMSVFPAEVELLVSRHPDVLAVAVVPMADPETEQRPLAFVQPHAGSSLTATELEAWCRENMSRYKLPLIEIVESMPMTATGKIRKTALTERASRG
ncbi:AMP-binding protein [Dietzia sp. NPDC055340]